MGCAWVKHRKGRLKLMRTLDTFPSTVPPYAKLAMANTANATTTRDIIQKGFGKKTGKMGGGHFLSGQVVKIESKQNFNANEMFLQTKKRTTNMVAVIRMRKSLWCDLVLVVMLCTLSSVVAQDEPYDGVGNAFSNFGSINKVKHACYICVCMCVCVYVCVCMCVCVCVCVFMFSSWFLPD